MDQLIKEFPDHIESMLHQLSTTDLQLDQPEKFKNIVVCGLGGSGIGGKLTQKFAEHELRVPLSTINDYQLPAFIDSDTLIIANSYSGNTEETLNAVSVAEERGATIVVISSNGQLLEKARSQNWLHISIKQGYPPRAALAFSLISQLILLERNELIKTSFSDQLKQTAAFLLENQENIRAKAKKLAYDIHGKRVVLYGDQWMEGILIRGRQQINENAKSLCWHHVFPEMNHNETVGWAGGNEQIAVLFLRSDYDFGRTVKRIDITKSIIEKQTPHIFTIQAAGASKVVQSFYLIHFLDWLSYELSVLKNVDPVEVDVIEYLKGELAKA